MTTFKKDSKLYEVVLISNIEIAKDVYVLSFPNIFEFKPGQVISIQLDKKSPSRMYSIASAIHEPNIRILFNIKDLGFLTPKLAKLNVGQTIFISEPFGSFLHDVNENDFFISAGTGIAPFNSFLQSYKNQSITLIHGSKTLDKFYFENELKFKNDKYIRCCSKEADNTVFPGRLTKYLEKVDNFSSIITYHLCGSAEMVNEVRDILIKRKVPYEKIQSEIYF